MGEGIFPQATTVMLVLTVACVAVNALGWFRLRPLLRVAFRAEATLSPDEIEGLGQLTGLIRVEAVYFTLLSIYAIAYPGVLALWPVLVVVLYHWLGWLVNERTRTTARAVAYLEKEPAPALSFRQRAGRALVMIGLLDTVEVAILVYIIVALGKSLHLLGY